MQSRRKLSSARSIQLGTENRRLKVSPSPKHSSPTPENRLIHSHRTLRRANLTPAVQRQTKKTNQEVFVHVRNELIYEELQNYSIQGLIRLCGEGEFQRKDLVVISKIQEFYLQYNSFCIHNQAHCNTTTWIIFTNAVNGKQIQSEFNHTYDPITFYFLKDVQEIVNYIHFKQQLLNKIDKNLSFFSNIVNFDAYSNEYAHILEYGTKIQLSQPSESNELWLISKKNLNKLNTKGYQVYYLGENSINSQKISLVQLKGRKILYILSVQDFELYLNRVGIKQFQEDITQNFLKKALFIEQQRKYYQKVIPNYLPNQIIINLQGFSKQTAELFRKQFKYVIRCKNFTLHYCHVYNVYMGYKNVQDKLGICLSNNTVTNQKIASIRTHFEALKNAKDKYQEMDLNSLYSSTIITNFSEQFKELKSQTKAYSHRSITQFSLFLRQLQQNSSHFLILSMQEYTQQRQKSLQQTQILKNVNFEVYLLYGNQFIFRNKNVKYSFLKKEQLLDKIKHVLQSYVPPIEDNLDLQHLSDYKSDIQYNRCALRSDTFSTPNLYYFPTHKTTLIICVPKSIPFYTLLDRSQQPYSLLTYSHIKQTNQMLRYLPNDHFAAIITSQKMTTAQTGQNFEYISLFEMAEKAVREEVDRLITKFQLTKRQGSIGKKRKMQPTLILYNHSNENQVNTIKKMNQLFKNSKVMTINKKQFKNIKKSYTVSNNIQLYQIGKPQIAFAKRLKTPLQIFKIYMSPQVSSLEFTAQKLQFSIKQLFLRTIIIKNKDNRVRSMRQLSLSRSLSPKGKSILQKQCFLTESGLVMLESKAVNKLNKRQKFNDSYELINLCIAHLQRGNQLLAVIGQEQFFTLKDELNVYGRQIIWIVLVKDDAKCIIRQSNIIFTKDQEFQHVLAVIIVAYRSFKARTFQMKDKREVKNINYNKQNEQILVEIKQQENQSSLSESIQDKTQFTIYFGQKIKQFQMKNLQNSFAINNKAHLNSIITSFMSLNVATSSQHRNIQIICDQRNKRFVEQTLKIIEEVRFIIITFENLGELSTYSSPSKFLFVLQRQNCKIKYPNTILVSSQQTTHHFSNRLKFFLLALRKN